MRIVRYTVSTICEVCACFSQGYTQFPYMRVYVRVCTVYVFKKLAHVPTYSIKDGTLRDSRETNVQFRYKVTLAKNS